MSSTHPSNLSPRKHIYTAQASGVSASPFPQALHKRPAAVAPSPVAPVIAAIPPLPPAAAALTAAVVGGGGVIVGAKKPAVPPAVSAATVAVVRGAPPPVPPNKPVVPPKKEVAAAFLRRAEQQQQVTGGEAAGKHFVKQNTVIANPAAQAAVLQSTGTVPGAIPGSLSQQQPVLDEEVREDG